MPFTKTDFPGLLIIDPVVYKDGRGHFFEAYNKTVFEEAGIKDEFIQDNHSSSVYGVIRGLHYQLNPYAQSKLIRVLSGSILDVALDLRKGSPTFGKIYTIELSSENLKQLYIPEGFAHGFSVLSERADVLYKCNRLYNKESEAGICYNDPDLLIDWKIPATDIILSEKDNLLPLFKDCRANFTFS